MNEYKPGLRDRLVWRAVNAVLGCATPRYREFIALLLHEGRAVLDRELLEKP